MAPGAIRHLVIPCSKIGSIASVPRAASAGRIRGLPVGHGSNGRAVMMAAKAGTLAEEPKADPYVVEAELVEEDKLV